MTLSFDTSKFSQAAARKVTLHDNCIVLDVGTGSFPRDIEVRLPDDDGARQIAIWDGGLDLAVDDEVLCNEYSGNPKWRVVAIGGADSGAGKTRVNKVWALDFTSESLVTDASDNVTINTGTLTLPSDIIHLGDADNKISFTDDVQTFTVGGLVALQMTNTTQDLVEIGDVAGTGDWDINFNNGDMFFEGSSGSLAIGTTATTYPVHGITTSTKLFLESPDQSSFVGFTLLKSSDTAGRGTATQILRSRVGPAAVQDGDLLGVHQFLGHDGTDYNRSSAIQAVVDGAVSANTVPSALIFQTTTTQSPTERMRITPAGLVGIGTASPSFSAGNKGVHIADVISPSIRLQDSNAANSDFEIYSPAGVNDLRIYHVNTTTDLVTINTVGMGVNGVTSPSTALDIGAGAMEFAEMTAPAAGAANTARLFARDDGASDTELCVRFSSGLIQVIAPLEFGEISRIENTTATALTVTTPAQYLFFDTNGPANGATPDHTNDHITVNKAGTYLITASISADGASGTAYQLEFTILKNNGATQVGALHAHRAFAGGTGDFGSISMSGLAVLSSGDTIELWLENLTSSQDITIEDVTLSITMVGVNA